MPSVRWVESFELMCTDDRVNWNKDGIGRREIYKIERLQQAFARLTTWWFGVLKPGQVKFALQDFAEKEGVKDSPEDLLELLVWGKKFLIPVNMLHGKALCYRVKWIYRTESEDLNTTILEDLDIKDSRIRGRLLREFSRARMEKDTIK